MSARSGLLVPVPEAEPAVAEHRARWNVHATRGVPAHVTALYPFVPPRSIDAQVLERVRGALEGAACFPFRLTAVGRFPGDLLYLTPEPTAPFLALTARLVEAFPAHPPYGGQFVEVLPHLTVVDAPGAPVEAIAAAITPRLPIEAVAREVLLMVEAPDLAWTTRARFPLAS